MRGARRRNGFSLAEIMVALVILSVIVMGLASTTITFLHETTIDTVRVRAQTYADTRIAQVRGWPDYSQLSTFAGTSTPEPGWTVTTTVVRDQSNATECNSPPFPPCPANDITRVTVNVSAPGLTGTVDRSISITAF